MRLLVFQHAPSEGIGSFQPIFEEQGFTWDVRLLGQGESFPENLTGYDGILSMGGPMGVYEQDRYPFLTQEIRLMQAALQKRIPMLGICLGSQLLAAAAGAKVYAGPEKEIGWYPVWLHKEAKEDVLFQRCPDEFMAFHWHGDTFDLPSGALLLASSQRYLHQAFRVGSVAWGVQFHLEVTPEMIAQWVEESKEQSGVNASEILSGVPRFSGPLDQLAKTLTLPFCKQLTNAVAGC